MTSDDATHDRRVSDDQRPPLSTTLAVMTGSMPPSSPPKFARGKRL